MQNRELNFRVFAREACPIIDVPAGETVFHMGEPGATMYVILAGRIDMVNGDRLIESLGARSWTRRKSARAMRPSELGSKSFFSDIFSTFSDKGETGTFNGEPARESLTAPPAGYQTPSPAQPYGLAPKKAKAKAATVEDRAEGTR